MPLRTLVIGTPMPHVSFDNYSFASAPSISEYTRLIVEMSAVSRVVEEISEGSTEHKTFAGQPVANGATTARTFGLADLLRMRAREATASIRRGGAIVCIAYPDAAHEGITGVGVWRSYEWLPGPDGVSYESDLLAGFGKTPVKVCDPAHPFAPYIAAYGDRMWYRVQIAGGETGCQVFGESGGGVPVAFDVTPGNGRIVLVPPLRDPDKDRTGIADTLFECFERLDADPDHTDASMNKEAQ